MQIKIRNPVYCGKIQIPNFKDEDPIIVNGQHELLRGFSFALTAAKCSPEVAQKGHTVFTITTIAIPPAGVDSKLKMRMNALSKS